MLCVPCMTIVCLWWTHCVPCMTIMCLLKNLFILWVIGIVQMVVGDMCDVTGEMSHTFVYMNDWVSSQLLGHLEWGADRSVDQWVCINLQEACDETSEMLSTKMCFCVPGMECPLCRYVVLSN